MLLLTLTNLALAADESADFSVVGIWNNSGGLARAVIVLLALMGIVASYVAIERLIAFRKARLQSMELAALIVKPLQNGDVTGALSLVREDRFQASYLAALLRAGLVEFAARPNEFGLNNARRAVDKTILEEIGKLKRGMPLLATTGSTGPFVGLFGTVFGVIHDFQQMSSGGSGLASVSAGISEALFTTGVGIGVAIIGVWLYNYFTLRADKVAEELVSAQADFVDWAEKHLADLAHPTAQTGK